MRCEAAGDNELRRNRLAWGCRRGMLELDVILAPMAKRVKSMGDEQLDALGALLRKSDGELWDLLVAGPARPRQVLDDIMRGKMVGNDEGGSKDD